MTQTVFLRLDTLTARASKTGTQLPAIVLTLCSTARLEFACVDAEDVVGPLTGTVVTVQCGVKTSPTAEDMLLLLGNCPVNGEAGTASRRIAAWTPEELDGDDIREFLGGELAKTGTLEHGPWMEIVITRDGATDRFSFPITLRNAFIRPEDTAPDPRLNASWEWLKAKVLVTGSSISRAIDETLKTITLSVSMAWGDVTGKPATFAPSAHSHPISDVTGLSDALAAKAASSLIGANSGIAPLDSGGKVPAANLPSYVDDVIEAADFAALPGSGETGKIYVTLDDNKTYRWSGSVYVVMNELPAFASQAEAEAGSDNSKLMTPLRTAEAIAALGGGGGGVDIQSFTADGTWTKPAGAYGVAELRLYGGGGGGGSGCCLAAGVNRYGGGGGGGAGVVKIHLNVDNLDATEAVTVGAGGTGGAAVTTLSNGVDGTDGGASLFAGLTAAGGKGGKGGTPTSGAAGALVATSVQIYNTTAQSSAAGGAGAAGTGSSAGASAARYPTGGGGGAGMSSVDAYNDAGRGGNQGSGTVGTRLGGTPGIGGFGNIHDGASGNSMGGNDCGLGGGGGSAEATGPAGNGGAGGNFGAGGGGGGVSATAGQASGAGGNGGAGYVMIITSVA